MFLMFLSCYWQHKCIVNLYTLSRSLQNGIELKNKYISFFYAFSYFLSDRGIKFSPMSLSVNLVLLLSQIVGRLQNYQNIVQRLSP